jgi:hypothetical protein
LATVAAVYAVALAGTLAVTRGAAQGPITIWRIFDPSR